MWYNTPGFNYLLDITYPVVSNICLPQIEQRPFLYAQPWQYLALFCVTGCLQSLHLP